MEKGDRLRESPNKDRNDDRLVSALETPRSCGLLVAIVQSDKPGKITDPDVSSYNFYAFLE